MYELIHRCGALEDRAQTEIAIYEWISWYNNARVHTSIGDMPPIEYEHRYYARTITPASIGATLPGTPWTLMIEAAASLLRRLLTKRWTSLGVSLAA